MTGLDYPGYRDLVEQMYACTQADQLEALIPRIVGFAGGTYRHELASTWFRLWDTRFPERPIDFSKWPPPDAA